MENNYYKQGKDLMDNREPEEAFLVFSEGLSNGDPKCAFGMAELYADEYFDEKDEQKAIKLCKEYFDKVLVLAQNDDIEAQNLVGRCYYYGNGIDKNEEAAIEWYTKAAEQGYDIAQYNLGWCYQRLCHRYGRYGAKDKEKEMYYYNKAIYWLTLAAEQGNPEYQFRLASLYENPTMGGESNREKYFYWLSKAAKQGYLYAQRLLGNCYADGRGVEQDDGNAVLWYIKAAEQGDILAQWTLMSDFEDYETEQTNAEEWKDFIRCAEEGLVPSQLALGLCYKNGNYGVKQDLKKAVYWFTKAAEQGDSSGQILLAECYESGEGVEKSYEKAFCLYSEAAEKDDYLGQYNLGICYRDGKGVEQNYVKAVEYFTKAAEHGHLKSKLALGTCYEEGLGVKADCKKAISCYEEVIKTDKQKSDSEDNIEGEAYYHIASIYLDGGKGVEKDKFKARKFFEYAKENNYGCDSEIDAIESELNIGLTEKNKMGKFSNEIIERHLPVNELFPAISAKLKEEFGGTWDMMQQASKECLVTGCLAYMALFSTGADEYKHMDFSAAIVPMMKACEIEFGRIFFNKFLAYLKENNIPPTEFNPTTQKFVRLNAEKSSKMEKYGEDKTYLYFRQKKGKGKETVYYVDEKFTGVYTLGGFMMYANIEKRRVVETADITLNISEMIDRDGKPKAQWQKPQNEQKEEYEICVDKHMLEFADKIFTEDAFPNPGRKDKIKKYLYDFANSTFNMAKWLRNPAAHSEIMEYWRAVYCGNMVIMIDKILQNFLSKIKVEPQINDIFI